MKVIYYQLLRKDVCKFVYIHPISNRAYTAEVIDSKGFVDFLLANKNVQLVKNTDNIEDLCKRYNTTIMF